MYIKQIRLRIGTLIVLLSFNSCKDIVTESTKDVIIPFELTAYNNIKIKTILNETDTLDLKFDSGTTGLLLTHDAIRNKTNLLKNNTAEDTITENYVKLKTRSSLQIGPLKWDDMEVYPVQHSGQGTDGRFGWDLFKDKIVSIDYDKNLFTVHQSLPDTTNYTSAKLEKVKTLFCLNGILEHHKKSYSSRFLFDTGYQRALLLDSVILNEQEFPKDLNVIKTNQLRNGAGEVFITKVVQLPVLAIAGQTVSKFPAQILNRDNPAGFKTHILGNELLKRFNTILDFRNNTIYFKKNAHYDLAYEDES